MATAKKREEDGMSFEQAILRLGDIVGHLEGGKLSLEKSLDAFEEGMALAKVCEDKLNEASARVEKIMKDLSGAEKRLPLSDDGTGGGEGDNDGV